MYEYIARFPLKLNLQLFAADGGASGWAGGEGGAGGEGAGDGGSGGGNGSSEKTFTQAELDAKVQARVSRAEKDAQKALAKSLGFDSVEALTAALKDQNKDANKDDKDKKQDPVDVEQLLEERLKEQNEKTFKRLLTADVKVFSKDLGFVEWEDAMELADFSEVTENEKGELEGVKEALEALAKKKPHLLESKKGNGRFGATMQQKQDQQQKSKDDIIQLAKSRGATTQQTVYNPWANK